MTNPYKDIEIKRAMQFEEDKPKTIEVTLEEAVDLPNEEAEMSQEPVVVKVDEQDKKRKSRAQERIRQVIRERDEERANREALEARILELEGRVTTNVRSTKEELKASLENQAKSILERMTVAIKAGEAEESVQLTDDLTTVRMKLAAITSELNNTPKVVEAKEEPIRKQQTQQVPEKALEWIEEHPEFKTDPEFNGFALIINNQLLREGFNPNDDEFYDELNTRMTRRFPEVFGIAEKKKVELDKNTDSSNEGGLDVTKISPKARTVEQTVSGSSRSAPAKHIQAKRTTTVELSPKDLSEMDRMGLTPKQMARRLLHIENNKQYGGYVPIMINKQDE